MQHLGRYEILEELSRGAEEVVYKARDPLLDRFVAVKVIGPGDAPVASDAVEQRFDREARAAAGLSHPNIVNVHDAGKTGDVAYIAMELLEGPTLREILNRGVPLAPAAIQRIAAQTADALAFIHQHGMLHGCVSPASLVVLDSGLVKITHFGGAPLAPGSPTSSRRTCMPLEYVAPEQALGACVDDRSDIFSLGVVVYEMLTGVPPTIRTDRDGMPDEAFDRHPAPPSSCNRNIPSAFDYVVARALAKDPDHRYRSAREMASDIRKLALEEPTFAPTPVAYMTQDSVVRWQPRDDGALPGKRATGTQQARTSPRRPVEFVPSLPRRRFVLFGVPAGLLALGGGSTLLLTHTPQREQHTKNAASSSPQAMGSEPAKQPLHDAAQPEIVRASDDIAQTPLHDAAHPEIVRASDDIGQTPVPPRAATARLRLAVSPWGEVYVDGRRKGISPPLREIELAPGRYTIEIRNTTFPPRSRTVDVKADARVRIKHKFH